MAHGMYEVLALLPESSDFTLNAAVAHFSKTGLRAELAGERQPSGFRVVYGDWAVVAWLEAKEIVLADSRELATDHELPAPADVIAACSRRLSVWSDEDPDFEHSDQFTSYTDELRKRFGAFIYDNTNGEWWT